MGPEDRSKGKIVASKVELAARLADLASAGALSVAPYLRRVARTISSYETKRDLHDPVTVHDRAVEADLRRFFGRAIPGSRLLGEEMGEEVLPLEPASTDPSQGGEAAPADPELARLGARVRWLVDPIDGTANFASGSTYFGTSVAAELDGKVVAGAITIPYTGELFAADLERAWHVDREGRITELHSRGPRAENGALLVSYYPNRRALLVEPDLALRHLTDLTTNYMVVRRTGASALDLAMVAAGWEGALLGMSFGPWDVAAGIHLVKVAGGHVVNLSTGADLPDGLRPALLATVGTMEVPVAERVLREYVATLTNS